jgi:transposase
MLIVETIAKVRRMYHVQNRGFKTIARELKLSKNTVKKIIRSEMTKQTYVRSEQPYKKLGDYKGLLESKLEHDREEPVRRRRTARKLYDELSKEAYDGSYEAVNNFVNTWQLHREGLNPSAFVPLEFAPGEAFQFDWSEEEIELAGKLTRIKVAHIRLCHSRFFLTIAYPNEQLEMVMDAHDKAFEFFGGGCQKGIYDNMKTAVTFVLAGKEREFNERFLEMASHHLFEPVACTPRSGWEKGQVENQVLTGRRNFFTPLVRVNALEALNKELMQECIDWAKKTKHPEFKEQTVWDIYQKEKASLLPSQGHFEGYKLIPTTVSSTSLVHFDTNVYSVDCHYVRKAVEIRAYAKQVNIYYKDRLIGEHARSFERYKKLYNPWHYVPLLERKPGALRHGAPFKDWQLPDGLAAVRRALSPYSDGDKQFIQLLSEIKTFGLKVVNDACMSAVSQGVHQAEFIIDRLKQKLKQDSAAQKPNEETVLTLPSLNEAITFNCSDYNALLTQNVSVQQGACYAA